MGERKLIHAVAGSGKTKMIIDDLDQYKRNLIITYTNVNQNVLKERIICKFGYIPENTHVFGVFDFLYKFCLVPYLGFRLAGIDFEYKKKNLFDSSIYNGKRIISYQLSKKILNDIDYISRINKFFDCIYIDECQDIKSYEFDWMISLHKLNKNIKIWLLGDFYQGVLSTSYYGTKGKGIHSDFNKWKEAFENFVIDESTLSSSYRCPKIVCDFIKDNLGINIQANTKNTNMGKIEYLDLEEDIERVMRDDSIKKLFYKESSKYLGNCQNWADSKGSEFRKVCVVLNKTTLQKYQSKTLNELSESTKFRFYVACTRTMDLLYFIDEKKLLKYKKHDVTKF